MEFSRQGIVEEDDNEEVKGIERPSHEAGGNCVRSALFMRIGDGEGGHGPYCNRSGEGDVWR